MSCTSCELKKKKNQRHYLLPSKAQNKANWGRCFTNIVDLEHQTDKQPKSVQESIGQKESKGLHAWSILGEASL